MMARRRANSALSHLVSRKPVTARVTLAMISGAVPALSR